MGYDALERNLRAELASIAIQTYQRGLVAGTGGNVSARIPGRDEVLITPTGVSLAMTTVENIVKTDFDARQIDTDNRHRPSKETGFHCAVYRLLSHVNAIVHVHPAYATALSLRFKEMPLVTINGSQNLKRVPCIDVALSGSDELRDLVARGFADNPGVSAILMRAHGVIATGSNLTTAYDLADLLEDCAKTAALSAIIGVPLEESVEVAFRPLLQSQRI